MLCHPPVPAKPGLLRIARHGSAPCAEHVPGKHLSKLRCLFRKKNEETPKTALFLSLGAESALLPGRNHSPMKRGQQQLEG